ncbi:carotenoid biosynthesis protein [Pontibacter sp. KCTC 32443]|uniref:carotenoid biosynthesis protein n=1 Tax=Pontibacter TaxID=323449 RepID=UPI00164DBF27|nr:MULTISPECIES: carotenoid biosynthesis protein [Pontibacter]MBC5775685.1 carotenoid biosynthesis protein [Pontibacter sp. KCTC 32443]
MIKSITDSATLTPARPAKRLGFWVALAVLIIFHAVGFWGLLFSGRPMYFQELTPLNLLLTNMLLFSLHRNWNAHFILFATVIAVTGFLAEVIGVHTGLLFGQYRYGAALGIKLWEVPLLIGLNWLMLTYSTGTIAAKFNVNPWAKALISSALMVLLDFFLEPVAMHFDFWNWQGNVIPFSNYIGWLLLAFLMQLYFHFTAIYKHNRLAPVVYLVQLLFFLGLYFLI